MKIWSRRALFALAPTAAAVLGAPLSGSAQSSSHGDNPKLPNGKSQSDEILKEEYKQNVKDAGRMAELAEQLKEDLEKDDRFVLSLDTLKRIDEIEKLAQKIRSRLRHN